MSGFSFSKLKQAKPSMRRRLFLYMGALAALLLSLLLAGCGGRIVHCDGCGKELRVSDSSNVDESWTILCRDCEKKAQLGE